MVANIVQNMYIQNTLLFFVECSTKANLVMVFGEITTKAKLDYVKIVRDTLEYIGYDDEEHGIVLLSMLLCNCYCYITQPLITVHVKH